MQHRSIQASFLQASQDAFNFKSLYSTATQFLKILIAHVAVFDVTMVCHDGVLMLDMILFNNCIVSAHPKVVGICSMLACTDGLS